MSYGKEKISKNQQQLYLAIYQQNWAHVRHNENLRIACLTSYIAILSGMLYVVSQTEFARTHLFYLLSFLSLFSIINLLVALKVEAVIEDYLNRNIEIAKKLKIEGIAGIRVRTGIWRIIRFRYIFPSFYVVMNIAVFYLWLKLLSAS